MLRHIGPPMLPTPMNPTFTLPSLTLCSATLLILRSRAKRGVSKDGNQSCRRPPFETRPCGPLLRVRFSLQALLAGAIPSSNLEYQLALQVTRLADPQRLLGLRQIIERDMRLADGA